MAVLLAVASARLRLGVFVEREDGALGIAELRDVRAARDLHRTVHQLAAARPHAPDRRLESSTTT